MSNPLQRVRAARMKALADGDAKASFWGDPELTTSGAGDVFEIWFDDMIDDWFGISAAMIVSALLEADGRDVLVHLNSPGGMVTEGLAIYNTFRQYAGKVTMRVEGLAASAASFVMLAGDETVIEPTGMVMVHDAWDITMGPAIEHRRTADLLDKVSDNIAGIYASKGGGTAAEWRTKMTENGDIGTWYIGREAVDAGLADSVTDAPAVEDTAAVARWTGIFAGAPKRTAVKATGGLIDSSTTKVTLTPAALVDADAVATVLGQRAAPVKIDVTGVNKKPGTEFVDGAPAVTPEPAASSWTTFQSALKGLSA